LPWSYTTHTAAESKQASQQSKQKRSKQAKQTKAKQSKQKLDKIVMLTMLYEIVMLTITLTLSSALLITIMCGSLGSRLDNSGAQGTDEQRGQGTYEQRGQGIDEQRGQGTVDRVREEYLEVLRIAEKDIAPPEGYRDTNVTGMIMIDGIPSCNICFVTAVLIAMEASGFLENVQSYEDILALLRLPALQLVGNRDPLCPAQQFAVAIGLGVLISVSYADNERECKVIGTDGTERIVRIWLRRAHYYALVPNGAKEPRSHFRQLLAGSVREVPAEHAQRELDDRAIAHALGESYQAETERRSARARRDYQRQQSQRKADLSSRREQNDRAIAELLGELYQAETEALRR
jgi:Skp family chaperone for outer membrane proteins